MDDKKNLIIRVTPDFHKELKVYLANKSMTMQDYIVNLVKEDMKKEQGGATN